MLRWLSHSLLVWVPLCALAAVVAAFAVTSDGLTRTSTDSQGRVSTDRWAWPLIDGADRNPAWNEPHEVRFEGVLWQGLPGRSTWRVVHNGGVVVRVDGEAIFEAPEHGALTAAEVPVSWGGEWLAFELVYTHDPAALDIDGARLEVGVYERDFLGRWALLPTHRLYTRPPDPALAARDSLLAAVSSLAVAGAFVGVGGLLLLWAWRLRLHRRREAWAIAAVVFIALAVRYWLLFDRAANDPNFYHLVPGSDNYVWMARQVFGGGHAVAGAYYQPGNVLWLALLMRLFGPHLWTQYALTTLVCALSVGAVVGAGWVGFGRKAGFASGVVAALYPPLIFYQTTVQPVALTTALVAVVALFGLWAVRQWRVSAAAAFGLSAGLAALVRPTALAFVPALPLTLLMARDRAAPWRGWGRVAALPAVALSAVALCFALLALAPQTLANLMAGQSDLISSAGPLNFYIGNNRDADGSNIAWQAFYVARARQVGYMEAAIDDLRADPLRAVELFLRKVGLFWGNVELNNNIDYYPQGVDASALLRALSLNGSLGQSMLAFVALAGFALALQDRALRRSPSFWLLTWMLLAIMGGTVLFEVVGRLRAPALPLLCIAAGTALVWVWERLRLRQARWALLRAGAAALAVLLAAQAFEQHLPRKRFFTGDLPPGVALRALDFNAELRLRGFEIESDYRPGGYAYVTLYWQAIAPPTDDYSVFVHLLDAEGNKVAARDERWLGRITYPIIPTSAWPVGATLAESYLIPLPAEMPPVVDVYTGLYDYETMTRLPLTGPDGQPIGHDVARLAALGTLPPAGYPALAGAVEPVRLRFGDGLLLTGVQLPAALSPGETVAIGLQCEAAAPVFEDYTAFFHLVRLASEDATPLAQRDWPALGPDLPTSALVPGHAIGVVHTLDLPADLPPGEYALRMGMYTHPSLDRAPVHDQEDRALPGSFVELARYRLE